MSVNIKSISIVALACYVGLVAAHFAWSQKPAVDASGRHSTYLVVYRPGPAWLPGKPASEQPLKEHGRYMLSLYKKGTLRFAGPFADNSGGAMAFEAANDDDAKAVVGADPAVASQVFVAELHPWSLMNWEQFLNKAAQTPADSSRDKTERTRVVMVRTLPCMDGEHQKVTRNCAQRLLSYRKIG